MNITPQKRIRHPSSNTKTSQDDGMFIQKETSSGSRNLQDSATMNITPQKQICRPSTNTKASQDDHLFIQRKTSSASKRPITPSKLRDQLQGTYFPASIHKQKTGLNFKNESREAIDAKIDAKAPEVAQQFAKTVEMMMWNDQPKEKAIIKRRKLRRRVAEIFEFPPDCFDHGTWAEKSKIMIDAEAIKQNSRPAWMKDWKNNRYDVYLPLTQPTPTKKKVHKGLATSATKSKRKKLSTGHRPVPTQKEVLALKLA